MRACYLLLCVFFALSGCNDSEAPTLQADLVNSWGDNDLRDGQLVDPLCMSVDPQNGDVFVADAVGGDTFIEIYSPPGGFVGRWKVPGGFGHLSAMTVQYGSIYAVAPETHRILWLKDNGILVNSWPIDSGTGFSRVDIARDANGFIYLTDPYQKRIQVFDTGGTPYRWWTAWGSQVAGFNPVSIAVDGSGNVFVADEGNRAIWKFESDGTPIVTWGIGEAPGGPLSIALDVNGDLLVLERRNHVQRFTSDGTLVGSWTGEGTLVGYYGPDICTANGLVYTLGLRGFGIQEYEGQGVLERTFGSPRASAPGQLNEPIRIMQAGDGTVLVRDELRIQRFTTQGDYLNAWAWFEWIGDLAPGPLNTVVALLPHGIRTYSEDGVALSEWSWGNAVAEPGGMDVDELGRIWVTDRDWGKVLAFSSSGDLLKSWGKSGPEEGAFNDPNSVAVRHGLVAVCDHNSLTLFDEQGGFERSLGTWTITNGDRSHQFTNVAMDDDYIYASGPIQQTSVFDRNGNLLSKFADGSTCSGNGRRDIAPGDRGEIFSLSPCTGKVLVYELPISASASPTPPN
jgi:DNA-binding beta-propeller fold protein YncE